MERKLIPTIVLLFTFTFIFTLPSNAQQGNTVFAQIVTDNVSGNVVQTVPSKYMVGQPYHVVTAIFSNRTGQTCSNAIATATFNIPIVSILASYDGSIFSEITNYTRVITPAQTVPATNSYRMMSSAAGAFPYIRVNVANWDAVHCKVNVFYSGSISGLDIKSYANYNSVTDSLQSSPISISASGSNVIVSATASGRIVVYGLVLYNQTSQNIILQDLRSDSSTTNLLMLTGFPTGGELVLPNTNFPMFTTTPGGTLQLVTQNNTNLTGTVVFRVE